MEYVFCNIFLICCIVLLAAVIFLWVRLEQVKAKMIKKDAEIAPAKINDKDEKILLKEIQEGSTARIISSLQIFSAYLNRA